MNLINEIIARDKMLGDLAREAKESASENKYMAAFACLSLLIEQSVKLALNESEGNLAKLIKNVREKKLITRDEFHLLERLRKTRNKLFHESHYVWHMEKNGIGYPLSEDETKKLIFDEFSEGCFTIALKLCSQNDI